MVLHGDIGSLKFNLYKSSPICVKYDFLTSSKIKLKYVDDDSTIFWAVGHGSSELVKHAERIGEEVEMVVPFEGFNFGEVGFSKSFCNYLFCCVYCMIPLLCSLGSWIVSRGCTSFFFFLEIWLYNVGSKS
ncbi:unnamed protein product, partial [Vitis vinifera]